jgi:hypothetical protein
MNGQNTSNKWFVFFAGVIILSFLLYFISVSNRFKATPDSSAYLGLGQSLAHGQGYQFNGSPARYFPPLLPVILAGVIKLSPVASGEQFPIASMKLVQVFLAILLAIGSWRLALRYLSSKCALLTGLLVLANVTVFQHCMLILSDVLYASVSVWALVLLDGRRNLKYLLGGILLAVSAWLSRSVGLLLGPAVFLWLLFGRREDLNGRKRLVMVLSIFLVCAVPFTLWKFYYSISESDYLEYWRTVTGETTLIGIVIHRLTEMVPIVLTRSVQILLNIETMNLPLYFVVIVFIPVLAGWCRMLRKYRDLPGWYALLYMCVMCIWFDQGTRFYLPVLPLLLIYGMAGLGWLGEVMDRVTWIGRLGRILAGLTLGVLAWPLIGYWWDNHRLPAMISFLRNGYIYCLPAGAIGLVCLLNCAIVRLKLHPYRIAPACLLMIYVAIGWIYGIGFALLEHGVVTSRGPMLAGYVPYYQMGRWLGEQDELHEPILCANPSIVHLGGGKLTRPIGYYEAEILKQSGQERSVYLAILEQSGIPSETEDPDNCRLREIVNRGSESFEEFKSGGDDPYYHLYIYRGH